MGEEDLIGKCGEPGALKLPSLIRVLRVSNQPHTPTWPLSVCHLYNHEAHR